MASKGIIAITYSEFDKIIGPELKIWHPADAFRRETFDSLSQYVIMDKEYSERIVMVEIEDWYLLSWSSTIENPIYVRNAVTFSFSLLLDKQVGASTGAVHVYGRALKTIARTFTAMEIEHHFLTNEVTKTQVLPILRQIYEQLSSPTSAASFCHQHGGAKSFFHVRLFRQPDLTMSQQLSAAVPDHTVPVLVHTVDLSKLPGDVSIQHLIMHIDGVSCIRKLAAEVDMDLAYVKHCLLLLAHHKVLILADTFKFSNMYKLVSDQSIDLLSLPEVEQEMLCFVVSPAYLPYYMDHLLLGTGTGTSSAGTLGGPQAQGQGAQPLPMPSTGPMMMNMPMLPSPSLLCTAIMALVADLHPAHTIAEIVLKHKGMRTSSSHQHNFFKYYDVVRLLAYLQHKEVVTRVHEYPIYMGGGPAGGGVPDSASTPAPPQMSSSTPETEHKQFPKLVRKMTFNKSCGGRDKDREAAAAAASANSSTRLHDVIATLDGSEHLDHLCCKYEVNHLDIINYPNVHIIYK